MAFSGRRTVSLQLYGLSGRVPGPFMHNIIPARKGIFQLTGRQSGVFQLTGARTAVFQLNARRQNVFDLEI